MAGNTDKIALHPSMGSNSLPVLADNIRTHHRAVESSKKTGLEHAIEAGRALMQAKNLIAKIGCSWLVWIKDNCEFTERTAQLYMKVAKSEYETAVSHFSFRNAIKEVTQPKVRATPVPPKSIKRPHNAGQAVKGRMKPKRRAPGSPPLKQNFIPNIPGYLEEMLLTMERCVIEYEIPPVDASAKAIIAHRLKLEHFDEIISWLTQLKEQVHRKEEESCDNIS